MKVIKYIILYLVSVPEPLINYGSGSGSDFLTNYGSGSGSTSQKVTVPTVPVPVPVPVPQHWFASRKSRLFMEVVTTKSRLVDPTLLHKRVYKKIREMGTKGVDSQKVSVSETYPPKLCLWIGLKRVDHWVDSFPHFFVLKTGSWGLQQSSHFSPSGLPGSLWCCRRVRTPWTRSLMARDSHLTIRLTTPPSS